MKNDHKNIDSQEKQSGLLDYFLHPTSWPQIVVVVILIIVIATIFIFRQESPIWLIPIFGVLAFFMQGLSGVLILMRGEYRTTSGKIRTGWRAYVRGAILLLTGWGFIILIIAVILSNK